MCPPNNNGSPGLGICWRLSVASPMGGAPCCSGEVTNSHRASSGRFPTIRGIHDIRQESQVSLGVALRDT